MSFIIESIFTSQTRQRQKIDRVLRAEIPVATQGFMDMYDVIGVLDLSGTQTQIFGSYFSGYLLRKQLQGLNFDLNQPSFKELSRIPVLSRFVEYARMHIEAGEQIAGEWFTAAEQWGKRFEYYADRVAYMCSADSLPRKRLPGSDMVVLDENAWQDYRFKFLQSIGSPASIRSAANMLSAVHLQSIREGFPQPNDLVSDTLARTKIRYPASS